jgi:ribosomal protein L7/L12
MLIVKVVGWEPGMLTISLIKLVRETTGKDLAQAKAVVDALLDGQSFDVCFEDEEAAKGFADRLKAIGCTARISDDR